jgi:hypothetical protein
VPTYIRRAHPIQAIRFEDETSFELIKVMLKDQHLQLDYYPATEEAFSETGGRIALDDIEHMHYKDAGIIIGEPTRVNVGDFVILEENGDVYYMSPNSFDDEYEEVEVEVNAIHPG